MPARVKRLAVLVGYRCNFHCKHCLIADKESKELSLTEIRLLRKLLASQNFDSLLFVGGEPTLYISTINKVLEGFVKGPKTIVAITTNGHFAASESSARETLKKINGLNYVQVSYDNYHKKFIRLSNIHNLYQASKSLGMGFAVLVAIQSPLDLVLLKELKSIGIGDHQIHIQGIHSIGAATTNHLEYKYPSFDCGVLSGKCPNDGKMVYMCGEGFTTCCSHLVFDTENKDYVHPSISRHVASKFYGLVSRFTFKELMKKAGLSMKGLKPEYSYPCALCGHIFKAIKEKQPSLLR